MFEVNNNTGHIFKFVSPAAIVKSKMAAIVSFFYVFNKTNIECFSLLLNTYKNGSMAAILDFAMAAGDTN